MRHIFLVLLCFSTNVFAHTFASDRQDYLKDVSLSLKSSGIAVVCGYTDYIVIYKKNKIGNINDNIGDLQKGLSRPLKVVGSQLEQSIGYANSQMCLIVQ